MPTPHAHSHPLQASRPPRSLRPAARLVSIAGWAGLALPLLAHAAGGHHAVDDASIADPGQCALEAWGEHSRDHRLQHAGGACRAGAVELGLNLDRSASPGEAAVRSLGLQLKGAGDLQPGLSLGATWTATWQSGSPRFAGHTALLLLTWQPRDDLALHLNLGREFPSQAPALMRQGLALEWQLTPQWQALAERWKDGLGPQQRLGLRHALNDRLTLDLSRARGDHGTHAVWWTMGLNWTLTHGLR